MIYETKQKVIPNFNINLYFFRIVSNNNITGSIPKSLANLDLIEMCVNPFTVLWGKTKFINIESETFHKQKFVVKNFHHNASIKNGNHGNILFLNTLRPYFFSLVTDSIYSNLQISFPCGIT